jgi:hypothetical protein
MTFRPYVEECEGANCSFIGSLGIARRGVERYLQKEAVKMGKSGKFGIFGDF